MKNSIKLSIIKPFCLLFGLLLFTQCKKDELIECTDPASTTHTAEEKTKHCSTGLTLDDISTTGTTTKTETGVQITGDVTIPQGGGANPTFKDASLDITTDDEGNVIGITGTGTIPAADGFLTFDDPFTGNIGFFTGEWLNENEDFCITLKDSLRYFVFNIKASFKMHVGGNNDPEASKPLTIQAPLGGEVLLIMNYDDPMFFTYGEFDLLGALGFGLSRKGNIVFEPDYPVENAELQSFDGKMIRCGSGTFKKLFTLSGNMVYNDEGPADAIVGNTDVANLNFEHAKGFNGSMELGLPFGKIEDFVEFKIPIAEGSGAFKTALNVSGEFESKAFLRGKQAVDDSWWPEFIPIDLNASTEVTAFVEESGEFEASIEGEFGIKCQALMRA